VFPDGSGGFVPNYTGHSLLTDCPALSLILLSFWLLLALSRSKRTFDLHVPDSAVPWLHSCASVHCRALPCSRSWFSLQIDG
jgi:hypothetical protein